MELKEGAKVHVGGRERGREVNKGWRDTCKEEGKGKKVKDGEMEGRHKEGRHKGRKEGKMEDRGGGSNGGRKAEREQCVNC